VIQEMSVQCDHIHLVLSIPPKVSVSDMMRVLKGKLAIKLFKRFPKIKQKHTGKITSSPGIFC